METTRSLMSSRKKKGLLPFYEVPTGSTSARIIEEARRSVRALPTERPYTPADTSRILFGNRGSQSRPPSVYSIGANHFSEEKQSRPPTGKLAPIEKTAVETTQIRVSSRVKQTPITPVQSLQDLSDALPPSTSPAMVRPSSRVAVASHSMVMVGGLGSASNSSLSSAGSADLEPKPSQSSPETSRRSLSAGKRVLSGGTKRVHSAGDARLVRTHGATSNKPPPRTGLGKREQHLRADRPGRTPPVEQRPMAERPSKTQTASTNDRKRMLTSWDSEVAPLLLELDSASSSSLDQVPRLHQVSDALWAVLDGRDLLGRTGGAGGSKRRGTVLRTVFRLLDHKDPRLLLKLSRIILAMEVTGKNLLNVCKLLFAVARNEANDILFLEEDMAGLLVDLLSMADPLPDSEALVYGLGTVKLLASNTDLRQQLTGVGVVRMLAGLLQQCTEPSVSDPPLSQPSVSGPPLPQPSVSGGRKEKKRVENLLVQLLMALRNLSESTSLHTDFLSNGIIAHLSVALSNHMANTDIVFSISRILSKLTLLPDCRDAIIHCPSFLPLLLMALTSHADNAEVTVRVCFILGNLAAADKSVRETLYFSHSALPVLEGLAEKYLDLELKQTKPGGASSSPKHASKAEDVLIKLVRLTANLSVHPEVGPGIACSEPTIDYLIRILASLSLSSHEELVLNALVTLNNLSYSAPQESCLVRRRCEITELLVSIVLEDSSEGLLECIRVYGNLSRYPAVRNILTEKKVVELLVTVLDSGQREVVYSSCGVLINLVADSRHRSTLSRYGGVRKLVDVLHDFGHSDWQLAGLVCQTLWNYSEGLTSATSCFGQEETDLLIHLLGVYMDRTHALKLPPGTSEEIREQIQVSWEEEFLPVAQKLLSRLETHHTDLIPLDTPVEP